MQTYILFTFAIYGIGGTQIYARNKLLYMQKHGWKTCMVTTEPGTDIFVKELNPYINGVFPELMRNPYLYSSRQRHDIINNVVNYIYMFASPDNEIVIESNFMAITPWAELIAEKLKAKNFIFLIQEDYNIKAKKYLDFFYFKYLRGELAANTPQALNILFKGYKNIEENPQNYLSAFCSNVIEDCDSVLKDKIKDADFNIGSIGRINKPFVLPMIKKVVQYVKHYPQYSFNLVLFGGSPDNEDISAILSETSDISNLNTVITGALFPIPLCDIKAMDVCISSAGAARTSTDAGILTISMDAMDFEPIGIVNCTTNDTIHRGNSPVIPLSELLDCVLFEKKYDGVLNENRIDYTSNFDRDVPIVIRKSPSINYYDVRRMAPNILNRIKYKLTHLLKD